MYDKRCLRLTDGDVAHRLRAGHKSIIPLNTTLAIFGEVRDAHLSLSTQSSSNLCPFTAIVDDYDMGITHALRGEENGCRPFPLHLDLYVYLKFPSRAYTHHSQPRWDKQNGYMQMIDFIGVSREDGGLKPSSTAGARSCGSTPRAFFTSSPSLSLLPTVSTPALHLQGWLTNIRDIQRHPLYLFIDTDLSTDEAWAMLQRVIAEQETQALSAVSPCSLLPFITRILDYTRT
ncbi:hypothetical protein M378DRAFT_16035 [Amanita muscaria Koide BX008]|uniref:Uncharacterized protein n=1 Tax=Amanita muscaria (strain Koide BX008) TaxID=946122 RepID=A0A0C2S4T6_AMAMK|nr:hypothetical protein M378DRAFT_16035 [Amanita muscaria Koide BX008]